MNIKKYLPIFALIFFSGCGIWTDFTTYFNLYFNTNQLYEDVKERIQELEKDPFQLKEPIITPDIKNDLITLQEKASKILQHNAESSYFGDAVYMSGYAFYYTGDYVKATRKFQELASLNNEDYNLESKLWIGKCDLQLRNFEDGMDIIESVRDSAIAQENDEVLKEAYRVIIAYHIDREEYTTAISEAQKLIKVSGDDEFNALVAYQIGLLYLDEGNEEEAVKAFESVLDFSPDFETEFDSKFELAKLNKELGNIEESRNMLNDLYNEGKYSPFWGDVYYELGLIEYEQKNYEQAFKIFQDVNELYQSSEGAIESQLMLGEIMRNVYADYDSAKVYYDIVKSSNADQEIKEKALLYSQSIMNYLDLKDDIDRSDRQITYILEPQEFLRDSLAYQRYLATQNIAANNQDQNPNPNITQQDTTATNPSDSTNVSDSTENTASVDSLFTETTGTVDLAFDDEYLLEEKPIYPNVDIDSLESKIANDYFALGNLFFTDLIQPDSAYYYYNRLLTEFPNTKKKPRALFALGTYYDTKGNTAKRDSLYNIVYNDYKTNPIASEAAKKLGKPALIRESDPAKDQYLKAETQLEAENYDSTFTILKSIVKDYPESIYKPKSLYTIGWIYENKINEPDSAAAYYSKIMEEYQNSEYAVAIRRKVTAYETEMKRLEDENKAKEAEQAETVPDSTNILNNEDQLPQAEPAPSINDSTNTVAEEQSEIQDTTNQSTRKENPELPDTTTTKRK